MNELPGQLSLWPEAVAPVTADAASPGVRRGAERPGSVSPRLQLDPVDPSLPDAAARRLIRTALQTNMLVEAGAGAGKTTEMVHRMLALVLGGVSIAHVAAVTFTRKAAAELRERFQTQLEAALRQARADGDVEAAQLLNDALRDVDRAFIGTIHSFCARLLRERPVDARLDPAFRELQGAEQRQLEITFWHTHLDRLAADGDPQLVELARAGLRPEQLFDLFHTLVEQPDVQFETEPSPAPGVDVARKALELWLNDAERLMPRDEPDDGWDPLHRVVQQLRYHRHVVGWSGRLDFLAALCTLPTSSKPVQKRWSSSAAEKLQVRELGERYVELMTDGVAGQALRAWRAHRYPIALNFGLRAADAFQAYREREGLLTFQDLLMLAARLLREQGGARRDLAERYRHLLVDEFQDTDPVQAEVVFLLAAGETAPPGERGVADWTSASPRAGALFVVGDPKQSIYRFRRADIGIYNQVKQRIAACGTVVELTANFRSKPALAALVNDVFRERFPAHETDTQAAFAPMNARREGDAGILTYVLDDGGEKGRRVMEAADPAIVATWIAERIAGGEREPGDFLVLARMNKFLRAYAAELEARGVPVQVTGGGIGIDDEVAELLVVLRALEDPGDGTKTLAALVGMFFGLDYEQITAYVLGPPEQELGYRRRLDITRMPPRDEELVSDAERAIADALRALHGWWRSLHDEPADVAIGRMVDALGLLPHAAAGPLGETRAGAVLFLLDTLRVAAARGDASLSAALSALEAAYADDDGEAPLRPGRSDVVRIMTLHKAKGLEAPVVMLVAPFGEYDAPVDHYIERARDGRARGWVRVIERGMRNKVIVHAAPLEWDEYEAREQAFDSAEVVRLMYVAATRARDELVVALPAEGKERDAPWQLLYPQLVFHAERAELHARPAAPRPAFDVTVAAMRTRTDAVALRRRQLAVPTYRAAPVKVRAGELSEYELRAARRGRGPAGRGVDWGSAVHGALEAAAQHDLAGERLREHCRGLLIAADRPVNRQGEPTELDELVQTVEAVIRSPLFARVRTAGNVQIEAPFALALEPADYAELVTAAGAEAPAVAIREIVEGVIDLAFREVDGWVLVDYKSDEAGSGIDEPRRAKYRAQVDLYAAAWQRITGEPVKQRTLLFTADGAVESW